MGKSSHFSTKSVFGQLISLIDDSQIRKEDKKHKTSKKKEK